MQTSMESQNLPNDSLELLNVDDIAALESHLPSAAQPLSNVFISSSKQKAEAVLGFLSRVTFSDDGFTDDEKRAVIRKLDQLLTILSAKQCSGLTANPDVVKEPAIKKVTQQLRLHSIKKKRRPLTSLTNMSLPTSNEKVSIVKELMYGKEIENSIPIGIYSLPKT